MNFKFKTTDMILRFVTTDKSNIVEIAFNRIKMF